MPRGKHLTERRCREHANWLDTVLSAIDVIVTYTCTGEYAFSVDASFVFTSSTYAAGEIQERVLINVLTILCLINKLTFTGK